MTDPVSADMLKKAIALAAPQVMSSGLGIVFRPILHEEAREWLKAQLEALGCKVEPFQEARLRISQDSLTPLIPYLSEEVQTQLQGTMPRKYTQFAQATGALDLNLAEDGQKDLALLSKLIWTQEEEGQGTFICAQITSDVRDEKRAIVEAMVRRNIYPEPRENGEMSFLRITVADWDRLRKELPPTHQVTSPIRDTVHAVTQSLRTSTLKPGGR